MNLRLTLALAAATAALLAGAVPAAAQNKPFYGVGQQGPLSQLEPRDFDRMREARVGTLRFLVNWPNHLTADGSIRWSSLDHAVGGAAARGVRSLPFIYQEKGPRTQGARAALAGFAGQMARRYGRGGEYWQGPYQARHPGAHPLPILAWQILNEQNSRAHWGGKPAPRAYGQALKATASAIRRANPRAEIVLGGTFGSPGGRSMAGPQFLNRLYKVKGIKRFFDTVAIHPYAANLRGVRQHILRTRKVMRQARHGKARIRVTEIGWGSATNRHPMTKGPRGQARTLRTSLRMLGKNRKRWRIRGVTWFAWQDVAGVPGGGNRICAFCTSAGLFTVARDPKPSWNAFRAATR